MDSSIFNAYYTAMADMYKLGADLDVLLKTVDRLQMPSADVYWNSNCFVFTDESSYQGERVLMVIYATGKLPEIAEYLLFIGKKRGLTKAIFYRGLKKNPTLKVITKEIYGKSVQKTKS